MAEKRGRGHPRAFKTGTEFYNKAKEYIDGCLENNELANVAGFCAVNDITRETYYKQREYYSDAFKKVEQLLENAALNANIPPAVKIFYLKNKFSKDYRDKVETVNTNLNSELTEEQADQVLKSNGIDPDNV